jgi:hypothetical protein
MATVLCDMNDEDLCKFVELQDDPASDVQNELWIYTCFLIFTRIGSMDYLERAIQRADGWIAVLAIDHADRARRFQIIGTMAARMGLHRAMEGGFGLLLLRRDKLRF